MNPFYPSYPSFNNGSYVPLSCHSPRRRHFNSNNNYNSLLIPAPATADLDMNNFSSKSSNFSCKSSVSTINLSNGEYVVANDESNSERNSIIYPNFIVPANFADVFKVKIYSSFDLNLPFKGGRPQSLPKLKVKKDGERIFPGTSFSWNIDQQHNQVKLVFPCFTAKNIGKYKLFLENDIGVSKLEFAMDLLGGPPIPQGPLRYEIINDRELTLSWRTPKQIVDDIEEFLVEQYEVEGDEIICMLSNDPWTPSRFQVKLKEQLFEERANLNYALVKNLKPGTKYKFRVKAKNAFGLSQSLDMNGIVKMPPLNSVPDGPTGVETSEVTCNSLRLRWKPPYTEESIDSNKIYPILGYIVQIQRYTPNDNPMKCFSDDPLLMQNMIREQMQLELKNDNCAALQPPSQSSVFLEALKEQCNRHPFRSLLNLTNWLTLNHSPEPKTEKLITGLKQDEKVSFRVCAVNRLGRGPTSAPSDFVEVKDKPTIPTRPRNLSVKLLSQNSANLTWREPINDGGCPLNFYQIEYQFSPTEFDYEKLFLTSDFMFTSSAESDKRSSSSRGGGATTLMKENIWELIPVKYLNYQIDATITSRTINITEWLENHKFSNMENLAADGVNLCFRVVACNSVGSSEPSFPVSVENSFLTLQNHQAERQDHYPRINCQLDKEYVAVVGQSFNLAIPYILGNHHPYGTCHPDSGASNSEKEEFCKIVWKKDGILIIPATYEDDRITIQNEPLLTSIQFNGLCIEDTGQYQLIISNETTSETTSTTFRIQVKGKPSKPKNLVCSECNGESVIITWAQDYSCLNYSEKSIQDMVVYKVELKQINEVYDWLCIDDKVSGTKIKIIDLTVNESYGIRVSAINYFGQSEYSELDPPFKAKYPFEIPMAPGIPKLQDSGFEFITITWDVPQSDGGSKILGYRIELTDELVLEAIQSKDLAEESYGNPESVWKSADIKEFLGRNNASIKDLLPELKYKFRVAAYNRAGQGLFSDESEFILASPPPSAPCISQESVKDDLIILKGTDLEITIPYEAYPSPIVIWTKGNLEINNQFGPKFASEQTTTVVKLFIRDVSFKDSGNYSVTLRNERGWDTAYFKIKVIGPPPPPSSPLKCITSGQNSIRLSWKPPDIVIYGDFDNDSDQIYYRVEYKAVVIRSLNKKQFKLNFEEDTSASSSPWLQHPETTLTNRIIVNNLNTETRYLFRVYAVNKYGESEALETEHPYKHKIFYDSPVKPCKPFATYTDEDSIHLSWRDMKENSKPSMIDSGIGLPDLDGYVVFKSAMLFDERILGYQLEYATTAEFGKSNISSNTLNEDGKELKWLTYLSSYGYDSNSGNALESTVMLEDDNNNLSTNFTDIIVKGLNAFVKYQFRVRSLGDNYEWSEYSDISDPVSIKSRIRVPDQPDPPEIFDCGTDWVQLVWQHPKDDGGDSDINYMIEYTNSPCSDNAWLVATNPNKVFKRNKILVSDLDNDKIYHFRLKIANSAGTSSPSFATEPVRLYCPGHKESGYSRYHNFTDQRIKVIKHLRDVKFPVHGTFQLECQVVGYPIDQIKWIRDGKEIHEKSGKYNFMEKGPEQIVLVVSDADKYDEGRYMVTIKNDLGLASSTCHVKYIEPPVVIHAPKKDIATLKQGCGGRIKIYVDGTPPFKYEVYKAGRPILERSDITADLQSKPSLIILPRSFSSSSSFDSDGTTDDIKVRAECSMDSSGIGTDISNPLNKNLFDSFTSTGENDDSCSSKSTNSSIVDYKLRGASARLQNFNKPIDGCNDILDNIYNNKKHSMDSEYTYVPKYARYKLIKSVDNVCLLISGVELSDSGDYNFEISNSSGIISKTINVKVLGAPSAPQGPIMSEIIKRSSEILASWSKPQNDGGSEITHYEMEKKEIGKSNWENCVDWTKDSNCTLRNFVPNIKYKIRVCAVNEHGKGPYLESDNALWIPLDITLPGPPTNLVVADVIYEYDSRKNSGYVNQLQKTDMTKQQSIETIELRWHEPFQKGGNGNSTFLGYLVERFDELHNKWITVNGHENNLDRIYSYKYRPSRDTNRIGSSRRTYSTRSSGLDEKLFPFLTKSESLRLGNIRSDMDYMFRVFSVNEVGKSLKAAECLKKATKNNFDYACGGEGLIEVITSLKNLTIHEGKTLRLETCIKAPLHSVIRWYKDNFELCTSLKYNMINVGTRHLLLVHDFNEHDQGNYDCVCVHLLNRVSTSATICLKEKKLEEYYLDQKVSSLEPSFLSNNNTKYYEDETNVNDTRMSLSTPYQSLTSLVESTSSNTLTDTETTISQELLGINNSKIKSKISQSGADSIDSKTSISQTNQQAEGDSSDSEIKDNNDNNNQTPNNKNNFNQQSNGDQKIVESSSNFIRPINRSNGTSPSLSITSTTLSSHTSENEVSISKNEGFAPIFTQVLPEIEVDDDESAILTCKVKGNPKPSIEWFKGNEKIIESDQSFETLTDDDGSCVLSIHAVEPYMDDTYVCLATNCYGSASTSSHLKVTSVQLKLAADALMTGNRRKFSDSDLSRPEIFNRSKDVTVPRGQTVTLECFVQGTPKPDVTWLFQDIPIIAENVDMFSEDDLYKLTIYDIEPSNSGVYTCVCTNIIGRDSCDITLTCK